MPLYVNKKPVEYKYIVPKGPQYCPCQPDPIKYGKISVKITPKAESPLLNKSNKKCVQQVLGSFLYYVRAFYLTILPTLWEIASEQANSTERTMCHVHQLLDYMYTNPNTVIRFYGYSMILNVHLDGSYITAGRTHSRTGAYFFLVACPMIAHQSSSTVILQLHL